MIDQNTAPYAALVLRVAAGIAFIAHALTKIFIFTIPGTIGFFESVGFPGFFAYIAILAELIGGTALIFGVAVRLVALLQLPVILGALWVHLGAGWMFTNEGGGWEYPAFWAAVQITIILLGRGAYALKLSAVDTALGRFA
ncbi:MAG: DoxX family protein [Cognatishimia sp.]